MEEKHVIWSDINLNLDDWRDDIISEHPEASEDEIYRIMVETNAEYIGDERLNLNIQLPCPILVFADLGLWNGHKTGYKFIESGNIRDCLNSNCDSNEWFVDDKGDLRCTAIHHDGTNRYLYRALRDDIPDEKIQQLVNNIYNGKASEKEVIALTERLGDKIGEIYGWTIPPVTPVAAEPKHNEHER